jgi:hypothetical protein
MSRKCQLGVGCTIDMRAVLLAIAACSSAPAVDLPISIQHPSYPVHVRLPAGWTAEATRADIYPADVWALHGPGGHVTLILGWLPRGGRQSAMFPGGRLEDTQPAIRRIAGEMREGIVEGGGRYFLIDFDVGELAVSVKTAATSDAAVRAIDAILDSIAIDPAAKPVTPSPARQAFELAREWARNNGLPTDHIVYVGQPPNDSRHAFTVFHDSGLVPLRVDLTTSTVTRMPL